MLASSSKNESGRLRSPKKLLLSGKRIRRSKESHEYCFLHYIEVTDPIGLGREMLGCVYLKWITDN